MSGAPAAAAQERDSEADSHCLLGQPRGHTATESSSYFPKAGRLSLRLPHPLAASPATTLFTLHFHIYGVDVGEGAKMGGSGRVWVTEMRRESSLLRMFLSLRQFVYCKLQ